MGAAHDFVELFAGCANFGADFLVGGGSAEALFEVGARLFDIFCVGACGARHVVQIAKLVDYRAANARGDVSAEAFLSFGVEPSYGVGESRNPRRVELVQIGVRGQLCAHGVHHFVHKRIVFDEQ